MLATEQHQKKMPIIVNWFATIVRLHMCADNVQTN